MNVRFRSGGTVILRKTLFLKYLRGNVPFPGKFLGRKGLTLIELMIVVLIIGTLAGIAMPSYLRYIEKARGSEVVDDIRMIERNIALFRTFYNEYPETLALLGDVPIDPWGNPYQYMSVDWAKKGKIGMRKDRNLKPVNTDYDLYSMGEDGESNKNFESKKSQDDIIRCNNGDFVGYVRDY